jgi:hypothetical protein
MSGQQSNSSSTGVRPSTRGPIKPDERERRWIRVVRKVMQEDHSEEEEKGLAQIRQGRVTDE